MIKLYVFLVENLNFFLQLLHRASVLVRGLKTLSVVLEGIQQCFQDILFDHPFLKCYNFSNILSGTDLRISHISHGLGPRASPSYNYSLLTLKFAKVRRGITSQFTLKRAKMQSSRLFLVQ